MAKQIDQFIRETLYTVPTRPKTEVFAYQHVLDDYEMMCMREDKGFVKYLRQKMAHALADLIVEKCQLFQVPGMRDLYRGVPIRAELTVNDRGTYENWLPKVEQIARDKGFKSGVSAVKNAIPYGFEPEQYYE